MAIEAHLDPRRVDALLAGDAEASRGPGSR
jgi:hypothetical protein